MVPLYFAKERPVVERDGTLIMVDDDRMRLRDGEQLWSYDIGRPVYSSPAVVDAFVARGGSSRSSAFVGTKSRQLVR